MYEKIIRKVFFKHALMVRLENMEIYEDLLEAVRRKYDTIALIKKSERGQVSLVRHRESGTRYIFRHFYGNGEVYQQLLGVSCRNLPQIMEVGEKDGQTVVLEEYILGDRLGEILEGGLLSAAPEQYGMSQSDGRADIYAVGVLLNIMLTGEHPSRKLAKGRMGRIVQRCTMVNPEKRYKNILHLMEVL